MTSGLVSVVVPCFNYARYLDQCVASLTRQTFQRWECIIVDDGSSDETPDVCARLSAAEPRVRFVRQSNAGLSAARNTGVREARGEFVQFLDADDLLEEGKLKVQVALLERQAGVDLIVGPSAFFGREAESSVWPHALLTEDADDVLSALVGENRFPVNAVLLRRSALDAVGGFDESLAAHEDWDLWLRCAIRGRVFAFASSERARALVRKHDANMSKAAELMWRTTITVRERIHPYLPAPLQRANERRLAEAKWRLGLWLMREGPLNQGWKLYWDGVQGADRKSDALIRLPLALPFVPNILALGRKLMRTFG